MAAADLSKADILNPEELEAIIGETDRLFDANETLKLYDYLIKYKDSKNEELLWRLARACREVGQLNETSADKKKQLMYEASGYANQAVDINPNSSASHKWVGITLSGVGDYEGNKKKINDAYQIKAEFEKAVELNPNDATSKHLIGQWCYTIAEMPWYTRKIAQAIFATPPTAKYEDAVEWFQACEDTEQPSFSRNHLWMGMAYNKLGNKEKAIEWLKKCRDYEPQKDEEFKHQKEAKELLAKLGVK